VKADATSRLGYRVAVADTPPFPQRFGQSAERRALLDRLELQLFELEEDQAQSETVAEIAVETVTVQPFQCTSPPAGRCPNTCRASAWVYRYRRPAHATACASWART
jgi:hypothetical protein